MDTEEQVFDFIAAAEDTGKRVNEMVKRFPDELRVILTEEWRRTPWLATLPATADRVTEAAKRAESAAAVLTKKATFAGSLVFLALSAFRF